MCQRSEEPSGTKKPCSPPSGSRPEAGLDVEPDLRNLRLCDSLLPLASPNTNPGLTVCAMVLAYVSAIQDISLSPVLMSGAGTSIPGPDQERGAGLRTSLRPGSSLSSHHSPMKPFLASSMVNLLVIFSSSLSWNMIRTHAALFQTIDSHDH